jgi:chromosome segregation ATPase
VRVCLRSVEGGGPLSIRSDRPSPRFNASNVSASELVSPTVSLATIDDTLARQDIARKQRDLKLGTLETDIDVVLSKLASQQKKTEQLADHVNRLNQEVEEERSARRLLEKVLLKMAEEQTLKVVERECAKERNARDASMKKMKQYADLIHEKITTREREAAAERQVQRSMIQVLARTRRALNKLHEQVMNNQGDLEEVRTPFHCTQSCKKSYRQPPSRRGPSSRPVCSGQTD